MNTRLTAIVIIGLIASVVIIAAFVLRTRVLYLNAAGQKRAVLLAETIMKHRNGPDVLSDTFLNELGESGLITDARGTIIRLKATPDHGFVVSYKPPVTVFNNSTGSDQSLIINWNPKMQSLDIKTTIPKP